jgi:hypothetical protein
MRVGNILYSPVLIMSCVLTCSFWGNSANNNEGQMARRVLILPFTKSIDRDPTTHTQILEELDSIIIKGNRAYKAALLDCVKAGQKDMYTFLEEKGNMVFSNTFAEQTSNNSLLRYIKHAVDSNVLVLHKLACISVEDMRARYFAYCEENNIKRSWNDNIVGAAFRTAAAHFKINDSREWPDTKGGVFEFHGAISDAPASGGAIIDGMMGYWGIGLAEANANLVPRANGQEAAATAVAEDVDAIRALITARSRATGGGGVLSFVR